MDALALEHICHAFDEVLAVDDLSLTVGEGKLVCLLGPSGCGKTTALRVAAGLERLQKGRVLMDGRVIANGKVDVPPEARSVGLVFQDYSLFPHLTVLDNVAFGLRDLASEARRKRALEVLEQVGMARRADGYPHTLSGGQQQRVALARALAPRPRVMLLDEPFSGLDSSLRHQIRDDTLHVLKESGTATLMVTHDPEEAMFMADKVALMRDGAAVQQGTPGELYFSPQDAFVASFFGEVNRLSGRIEAGHVPTPLGQICAPNLPEGAEVEILIRPEALRLDPQPRGGSSGGGATAEAGVARVVAARVLGRSSLIHLSLTGHSGADLHLHARVPGRFLPAEDQAMGIHLDPSQTFVFLKAG